MSEISPTSEDGLSGILEQIAAKSCSLDPVHASLLRYCIDDLLPIIKRVVNLSFNSASMPSSMKNAVLSPLLKKPSLDFEIFSNFRPVSNLKFLSKVIEKVAAMRLTNYLCDNDLNESLQSAYKKHHSCETALLRVQNDILKSIDNKQCIVLLHHQTAIHIWYKRSVIISLISRIESCLVDIANWMTTNKLKLNTDYSRFRLPPRLPSIRIGTYRHAYK